MPDADLEIKPSLPIVLKIHFKKQFDKNHIPFCKFIPIHHIRDHYIYESLKDIRSYNFTIQTENPERIAALKNDLEHTTTEKIKSISWDGFIKGQVYDSYTGIGAIPSDLIIYGDLRDLGIQGWKRLTKADDFDGMIAILSAAGIGLSTTAFVNGSNALVKNTLKYLKKVPKSINTGLLKKFPNVTIDVLINPQNIISVFWKMERLWPN